MRIHIAAIVLAALITALAASAQGEEFTGWFGIPGADPAWKKECGGGTAYVYPKYIIYTRKSPAFEGQDIYVYKPASGVPDPCPLAARNAYYTISAGEFGGANTFVGMHGGYLLVDEWPGRDHKRLLVIDVAKRSLVYFDWYADARIEAETLLYNRVLKASKATRKNIPCPDAEKWEKEGSAVLYVEGMTLDLGTMKETHSGKFFCEPAPAITKRARDYTIH
jgi:hypothetical protein